MPKNMRSKSGLAVVAIAAICGGGWWAASVSASDHDEAPLVKANAALDISDLYIFESEPGRTTIIVCWAGFNDSITQPTTEGVYDDAALYTIHIDNDLDNVADIQIYWRYGRNDQGDVGVKWEGIPGADGAIIGPVESIFQAGTSSRVWSGHAEDPFFFDAGGYLMTLDTGMLSITPENDFLAGLNVTAAAIEIGTELIQPGNGAIQVWSTVGTI